MTRLSTEIAEQREQVVSALAVAAESLNGSMRRRVMLLADYLAFSDGDEAVTCQPILLEVFLKLRDGQGSTQADIDETVQQTIAETLDRQTNKMPWWSVLIYPAVVLLVCGSVTIGICLIVVPTFEKMFDEFGLSLPLPTIAIIKLSHWIAQPWLYLSVLALVLCVGSFVWLIGGNEFPWARPTQAPQLHRQAFSSTRKVWADWLWHLSLLVRSGQSDTNALLIAGSASGRRWLRTGSVHWARRISEGEQPFAQVTHFRGKPCHLMSLALNSASYLTQDEETPHQPHMQADLLSGVAEIYWDRDRSRSQWRLSWLSPVLVFLVGFIVWFVLIALFMPLISLITGLS